MKKPLVSTLICTYNAESFIWRTLESVIKQTYEHQEILIFDDVSKDKTVEILKRYAEKDKRIKIFADGKKRWAYWWLNHLLDNAKWEYIAIQDHDDIWHSQKLEKQINFLENDLKYIWSWTGTLMYYGHQKLGFLYDTKDRDTTKVIHTSLVFRNRWFRYDTSIDFLVDGFFMQNILTKGKNILKVIPEPLTLHYYKWNWSNYSEQRFKFNRKNIKIFFSVYGYWFYYFLILIYISLCKILPLNIKNKLDFKLLCYIKKAETKNVLEKNEYLKEMLSWY